MDKIKLAEEYAWRIRHSPIKADVRSRAFLAGFDAAESIANAKIQELEQKLKNSISIDAHLEWKREWEQQLKDLTKVHNSMRSTVRDMFDENHHIHSVRCMETKGDCVCHVDKIRKLAQSLR